MTLDFCNVVVLAYKAEAMESLKLGKKLNPSECRTSLAISAGQKDYYYGHLLQSASQISKLLQSMKSDAINQENGTAASNPKVKDLNYHSFFCIVFVRRYELFREAVLHSDTCHPELIY